MGRVLVTGGARGMGAATVRALVAAGHDVTFTVRSSGAVAEALVAELKASHPERDVAVATVDLADKAAVAAFCEEIAAFAAGTAKRCHERAAAAKHQR